MAPSTGQPAVARHATLGGKNRLLRRVAIASTLVIVAGYLGVLGWFRVNEDRLVFHAVPRRLAPPPASLRLESREVAFSSGDGTPLVARVIPPPKSVPASTAGWILYLHGAGGNVGVAGYNQAWARLRDLGLGVFAVDYRGYGESGGAPSEAGLYGDAAAAYTYLTDRLGVAPSRIVIYGYSLGSAVAITLATQVTAAGVILEGALRSVPARGAEQYPFLPVAWLARNRFAAEDKVASVTMPKLFIHARDDVVIPIAHGRRLYELARAPKYFQEVEGGHLHAYAVDPAFIPAVGRFVAGLGIPAPAPPSAASGTR
jgi:pimeloyl-ACP methyl ester carboxylesterase